MVGENLNSYDETEQISPRQREETFLKTLKTVLSHLVFTYVRLKVSSHEV